MTKSSIILVPALIIFLVGTSFISDNKISIEQEIPSVAFAGDEFTVTIHVNKGDATGAARLQYELPEGFTGVEMSGKGADFIFEDHSVKFIWTKLPEENNYDITFKIIIGNNVIEHNTITGVFVCVNNGKTERFSLPPAFINIQQKDGRVAEKPKVETPKEATPDIKRQLMTIAQETGEYKMEITINPNNITQAAKFTDEIPANFQAEVVDAHGAVVTIENNSINFYWKKLPSVKEFKISYFARSGEPGPAPVINGYFTFNNFTKVKPEPKQIATNNVSPAENTNPSTEMNQNAEASASTSKEPLAATTSKPVSQISTGVSSGITYRVQVSATQKSSAKDNKWFHSTYQIDSDVDMTMHEGWKKYLTGNFTTIQEASSFKNKTKEKIPDAFIVAYENGIRITLEEAKKKQINKSVTKLFSGFWFYSSRIFILAILFFCSIKTNAQDSSSVAATPKKHYLPIVSIATGPMNFYGDVGYSHLNEPLLARSGFQFEVQAYTEKRLSFALNYLYGNVFGDEKTVSRIVNFKSNIQSAGLMLRYDFISKKRSDQVLIPFLTAGAEYLMFKPFSDLKDASGNVYNYWSDGSIRNIPENDPAADQAVIVYRDYVYETDLHEANLDGFGEFKNTTWGVPVGGGFRFKISERCGMHFSSVYHITGSDFIDGITIDSKGSRHGDSKNDNFFYTSVSFRFALSRPHTEGDNVDFNALANEDADGDGIPDIKDDSSGTPQNSDVSINGKPMDADNDGIPDYRDKELNSAADAVVTEEGITITEEMIEAKFREDSLGALPAVIEYLKSYDKLTQRNPGVEKKWMDQSGGTDPATGQVKIPEIYRPLDKDKNGIITPREIGVAIDDYLANKTKYSVSEFFDLIDFFFTQH